VIEAAQHVMEATGVPLEWCTAYLGRDAVERLGSPVPDETVDAIDETGIALKGPIATPPDGSMRSPNVGLRRALALSYQVRRAESFGGIAPQRVDVYVVRETTEDLYAGVGFDATSRAADEVRDVCKRHGTLLPEDAGLSIKFLSETSCRALWEFSVREARRAGCTTLTAAHKSTVMRHTDGIFVRTGRDIVTCAGLGFDAVAVDTLAARLVSRPSSVEMIVAPNLYGDILADVAGAVVGGVGVVAGGNFGSSATAVFEAAHGAAWRHVGRDTASPVGAVRSGALALRHAGHDGAARAIEDAVRYVSDGIAARSGRPASRLTLTEVTGAIIEALPSGTQASTS
jgi:isocitrate dehydrogenase (NAD+)